MSTHAVIQATPEFDAKRLGKFDGMLIPLERRKYVALTSIMLVIDGVGYRAHPTKAEVQVNGGTHATVFHVSPIPVQVET